MRKHARSYLFIIIGVLFIALAYYFLFLPQDIVTGGVTGITIIFTGIFGDKIFSSALLILILNIILLVVGLFFLGKEFFIKTLLGSLLLPFFISVFEMCNIPSDFLFTLDQEVLNINEVGMNPISQIILSVLLGSILTGVGLGLCFRFGATTGGMDIVQKIIAKVFHFPYSKTVYITDGVVVIASLFVFGVEKTLYGLIAIYLIGIFVDVVHIGGASRRSAFILSKKNEEIKEIIINRLGRGVTIVPSIGGYSGHNYEMLICTLSKSESYLLKDLIYQIDPLAFTFFTSAKEVYGDGFQE